MKRLTVLDGPSIGVGAALAAIPCGRVLFAAKAVPTGGLSWRVQFPLARILICLWLVMAAPAAFAAIGAGHILGGCTIGASDAAHGLSDSQAVAEIRQYANLYVSNFQKFRKTERAMRKDINKLIELEQWTQADIVSFTKQQRELLYLSIGMEVANGRITVDELPKYARTIRQKITDIEIELGCDVLPNS